MKSIDLDTSEMFIYFVLISGNMFTVVVGALQVLFFPNIYTTPFYRRITPIYRIFTFKTIHTNSHIISNKFKSIGYIVELYLPTKFVPRTVLPNAPLLT